MLRSRFGTKPLSELLAAAIFYADDGFPVSDVIANAWASWTEKLAAEQVRPIDDVRASARYRKLLVATLVERALAACVHRMERAAT